MENIVLLISHYSMHSTFCTLIYYNLFPTVILTFVSLIFLALNYPTHNYIIRVLYLSQINEYAVKI